MKPCQCFHFQLPASRCSRSRCSCAVAFLLSLLTGTWERGTSPSSVGVVCPWCPCLSCGPWFFWLREQGQQDPASLLFVAQVLSAPGGSWCPSRCCCAASAYLFLFSLHPKGFPTTSQKCLIGHRICPVLFCLAVLAWQAGELGVPVLVVAPAGSRCRSKTWRRRRGTVGTPHFLHPALWHTWLALLPQPQVSHLFLFHGRASWDRPIPHRGRPAARAWPGATDGACLLFLPRKRPSPPGDAAAPERLEALKYQRIKKPKKSSKGSSKSRKQPSECEDPTVPNSIPCVLL